MHRWRIHYAIARHGRNDQERSSSPSWTIVDPNSPDDGNVIIFFCPSTQRNDADIQLFRFVRGQPPAKYSSNPFNNAGDRVSEVRALERPCARTAPAIRSSRCHPTKSISRRPSAKPEKRAAETAGGISTRGPEAPLKQTSSSNSDRFERMARFLSMASMCQKRVFAVNLTFLTPQGRSLVEEKPLPWEHGDLTAVSPTPSEYPHRLVLFQQLHS